MRYLKYINESFNHKLYVKIFNSECKDLLSGEKVDFNKREIDFLKENLKKEFTVDYYPTKIMISYYTPEEFWEDTCITKLEDSYFIFASDNPWLGEYKCDQFEGLNQLLKDKEFI